MTISIIGNVNIDIILRDIDELADPGGERHISDADFRIGGSAATTALALSHLGLAPRLYGAVGSDALGSFILTELGERSLAGNLIVRGRTCLSIATESPRRDRSFLTYLGALESFGASDVPEAAWDADSAMISGHFALPALRHEGTSALLTSARQHGARTLFDPGPEPGSWTPAGIAGILTLLPMADIFLPNESEACAFAGARDPIAATEALAARSGGWVVTKMGAAGAAAAHSDSGVTVVRAPRVRAIDTVGAGDTFNAGLLYGLHTGRSVAASLPVALATASLTVSRASDNRFPSISEVNRAAAGICAAA